MKVLTSPIEKGRFSGTIEVPEYLTLPQVMKFREISAPVVGKPLYEQILILWPLYQEFTGEWRIEGVNKSIDIKDMPFTPAENARKFASLVLVYFANLIVKEEEIPND